MSHNNSYPEYKTEDWIQPEDQGCLFAMVVDRDFSEIEHSHDYYEFLILFSGKLVHKINGKNYETSGGDLWIIRPGERHRPFRKSDALEAAMFSASAELAEPFLHAYGLESILKEETDGVLCQPDNLYMHLLHSTFSDLPFATGASRETQHRIILGVLSQCFAVRHLQQQSPGAVWIRHILLEMRKPENLAAGVSAMERLSNLSRAQLCRFFKKYVNQTPQQFVLEARLNYAHNLICNTDQSIDQIANTVGYTSLSHFSTIFKERYRYTPSELRKKAFKLN